MKKNSDFNTAALTIMIIGDSLAFPRETPEVVRYADTYLAILKKRFPFCDFIHKGLGGSTIVGLYNNSHYFHRTVDPDLVFIQSGIVDAAPRTLTFSETKFISALPKKIGDPIFSFFKKNDMMIRKFRKITYTSFDTYVDYVNKFESIYQKIYWIDIMPVSEEYEKKIPGIKINKEKYSAVLKSKLHISTESLNNDDIMSDHHHLNKSGHLKMSNLIADVINKEIAKNNH